MDELREAALRKSKRSTALTLVGFVVFGGWMVFSTYELRSLERQRTRLADQNSELATEKELLESNIDELQTVESELQARITSAKVQLERLQMGPGSDDAAQAAWSILQTAPRSVEEGPSPKVYIHLRSNAQSTAGREMAAALREQGFEVPAADILVDVGPRRSQIRYFRASDMNEAERIAGILGERFPNGVWDTVLVDGYENSVSIRPLHFELWLAPGAGLASR